MADIEKGGPMKRVIFGFALIACLPVIAQDTPRSFQVFKITGGYRIVAEDGRFVNAIASTMESTGPLPVIRFKGNVDIKLVGVEIQADEVDYHWQTGECEPLGNVHVKPVQ
jgi:lipopolysaccharide assembly outer membrane protein LptD (OstA)